MPLRSVLLGALEGWISVGRLFLLRISPSAIFDIFRDFRCLPPITHIRRLRLHVFAVARSGDLVLVMGAPPMWSLLSVDFVWVAPPRATRKLRALKVRLNNGGTVYGRPRKNRSSSAATFEARSITSHPRTSESGGPLSAITAPSSSVLNWMGERR